jgi:thiaminase/transcriptional activator TenA
MSERRFSDVLRAAAAAEWGRMQAHPFVRAIEADALPASALRRYLIIECGFVDSAISIFGYALVKAPDLETRRALVTILRGLTEDQMPFFEQAFTDLGVTGEPWREPPPPAAAMLREAMLGYAAHGGFAEVTTAMLAAEWTYREFCGRALQRPIADPVLHRWLELHVAPAFDAQVAWLRRAVDRIGKAVAPAERARLVTVFRTALELEIHFHGAAMAA